jgi:hypothetical protein
LRGEDKDSKVIPYNNITKIRGEIQRQTDREEGDLISLLSLF